MNITLPTDFENRMKSILGDEYSDYLASFEKDASKGLHLNTLRVNPDSFAVKYADIMQPLDYACGGFIYNIDKIGTHPLSHSGLVYSQDPGAMMPVASVPFDFDKDYNVLDLCAAPGGKSSQLAIKLAGNGFLVSNEPVPSRNKILMSNLERMGYDNNIITCAEPAALASAFPSCFDFILIDAPCSGEGMFRKYPESVDEWSVDNVKMCAERQKSIIDDIMPALRPGGYILYSTCTYSPEENEEVAEYILSKYDMHEEDISGLCDKYLTKISGGHGGHFFPHKAYGEGQYMCLFKSNQSASSSTKIFHSPLLKSVDNNTLKLIDEAFGGDKLLRGLNLYNKNNSVYAINDMPFIFPSNIITRMGTKVGEISGKRFIPDHHFFKVYGNKLANTITVNEDDAYKYLRGEELFTDSALKGYAALLYEGGVLGFVKSAGGRLKNHYPKGLRNFK